MINRYKTLSLSGICEEIHNNTTEFENLIDDIMNKKKSLERCTKSVDNEIKSKQNYLSQCPADTIDKIIKDIESRKTRMSEDDMLTRLALLCQRNDHLSNIMKVIVPPLFSHVVHYDPYNSEWTLY